MTIKNSKIASPGHTFSKVSTKFVVIKKAVILVPAFENVRTIKPEIKYQHLKKKPEIKFKHLVKKC